MLVGLSLMAAAFCSVFLLGVNSKLLRDDKIMAAAIVSWLITIANYATMWVIVHTDLPTVEYILWAGTGGSTGITLSQYFYKWFEKLGDKNVCEDNHGLSGA